MLLVYIFNEELNMIRGNFHAFFVVVAINRIKKEKTPLAPSFSLKPLHVALSSSHSTSIKRTACTLLHLPICNDSKLLIKKNNF